MKKKYIYDKFLELNTFIWRDGITVEPGIESSSKNAYISGDDKYYSGIINIKYTLVSSF